LSWGILGIEFDKCYVTISLSAGNSCQVKNLTTDPTDVYFGSFSKGGIPPHILNSRGALHFLKSSGQVKNEYGYIKFIHYKA
jgi:hypothetical protein